LWRSEVLDPPAAPRPRTFANRIGPEAGKARAASKAAWRLPVPAGPGKPRLGACGRASADPAGSTQARRSCRGSPRGVSADAEEHTSPAVVAAAFRLGEALCRVTGTEEPRPDGAVHPPAGVLQNERRALARMPQPAVSSGALPRAGGQRPATRPATPHPGGGSGNRTGDVKVAAPGTPSASLPGLMARQMAPAVRAATTTPTNCRCCRAPTRREPHGFVRLVMLHCHCSLKDAAVRV